MGVGSGEVPGLGGRGGHRGGRGWTGEEAGGSGAAQMAAQVVWWRGRVIGEEGDGGVERLTCPGWQKKMGEGHGAADESRSG